MPEDDNRYIKRYNKGPYEIRIGRDVGRFFAQIYTENVREDVLTASTPAKLDEKVRRYLAGGESAAELESLKSQLVASREEIAAMTKTLTSMGDGNAKAAQYEKELEDQDAKIKGYEKQIAKLEDDVDRLKSQLDAVKANKTDEKKTATASK